MIRSWFWSAAIGLALLASGCGSTPAERETSAAAAEAAHRARVAEDALSVARERIAANDEAGALRAIDQGLVVAPDHAALWKLRAHVHVRQCAYDLALPDFERAVALDPRDPWVHYARGVPLNHVGRVEEAIASFSRAIELDARYFKAWQHRGDANLALGRFSSAVVDFTRAIQLAVPDEPELAQIFRARANAYVELGDDALARADYDREREIASARSGIR